MTTPSQFPLDPKDRLPYVHPQVLNAYYKLAGYILHRKRHSTITIEMLRNNSKFITITDERAKQLNDYLEACFGYRLKEK